MTTRGKKTYALCALAAAVGLWFVLTAGDEATWDDPMSENAIVSEVRRITAGQTILLAAIFVAMRAGISKK